MKEITIFLALALACLSEATSKPSRTAVNWHECPTDDERTAGLDCGELLVPLDWSKQDGETITLSMNRLVASNNASRIGSIVFNTGGPGDSVVERVRAFALSQVYWSKDLKEHFDLIGLDPRGVGRSSVLRCDPKLWNERPSQFVKTDADFERLVAYNREFALRCHERSGDLVKHADTLSVARDLDALRRALGEEKINFFGQSYGTQIGGTYAELFPKNLRAMALDGNVDHSLTEVPVVVSEVYGYEAVWNRFVIWCHETPDCALHGQDVDEEFDQLVSAAFRAPLEVPDCKASGACRDFVRPEDITGFVQGYLDAKSYHPGANDPNMIPTWSDLAEILKDAFKGNLTSIAPELATDETSDLWQNNLITCLDWEHNATKASDLIYQNEFMFRFAPHTRGTAQTYAVNAMCAGWPFPLPDPPHLDVVKGAAPALLLNSYFDPETPFDQAVSLQRQLTGSVLLANKRDGHTTYKYAGPCSRMVDNYLVNLTLPAPNSQCEF